MSTRKPKPTRTPAPTATPNPLPNPAPMPTPKYISGTVCLHSEVWAQLRLLAQQHGSLNKALRVLLQGQ